MRAKALSLCFTFLLCISPQIAIAQENEEEKFGFYSDRMLLSNFTILFDKALSKRISQIGERIARVSSRPDIKYAFRIINDPSVNAYSAAGGMIYITTGLLDFIESADELAAVIAHEIAHVVKSHQIDSFYEPHRSKRTAQIAGTILGVVLAAGLSAATARGGHFVSSLGQSLGDLAFRIAPLMTYVMAASVTTGYGKEQELDADALAIEYTKRAGYDARAFIDLLRKLTSFRDRIEVAEKKYASKLVNAEPGLEERIERVEEVFLRVK